jgi:fido (protein-threonine AMPylation protein)
MPTRYDVFAKIVELAPCRAKDLAFKVPVYSHIDSLVKLDFIKKTKEGIIPIKNETTESAFKIIKYCLKNGLDYNKFFTKKSSFLIKSIFKSAPNLRPKKIQGNQDFVELLSYLENNQFILISKKRPRTGIILQHKIFNSILSFNKVKNSQNIVKTSKYLDVFDVVLKLKSNLINPFDDEIFSFLSGSAQLEGSTITAGETRELLVNDIYPQKPQKDVQMVKNLNEALGYILENLNEKFSEDHIKMINRLVLFSLHKNSGQYKKVQNKIQGNPNFKTTIPTLVSIEMKNYLEKLNQISTREECLKNLGFIHNEIQRIHPFSDGNSRTTRLILNWILLKFSFPLLVIKMGCFDEYMGLTKLSSKRDDEKLSKLFYHLILHESLMVD